MTDNRRFRGKLLVCVLAVGAMLSASVVLGAALFAVVVVLIGALVVLLVTALAAWAVWVAKLCGPYGFPRFLRQAPREQDKS